MTLVWAVALTVTVAAEGETATTATAAQGAGDGMPYVYTNWKHYTVADGLPNDHIFAVKADGPYIWVGTENGLARITRATGEIRSWLEKDGLPWQVVTGLDVHPKTGDLWLALFGGGLARFSGGRFDQWTQMNSGLVNDVVYGVAVQGDNIWAATTAGASRFNTLTREWTIYTEKNAPMEEIWNYGVCHDAGSNKVFLAIWGSGVLEFDVETENWTEYLDPDGEMEIVLYRDDGIVHVITTGVSSVEGVMWVSTYFGTCRYDGRNWRGYFEFETGAPSDFTNNLKGRSAIECWFATDKGIGAIVDSPSDTWVQYRMDPDTGRGKALVTRGATVIREVDMERSLPHNFTLCVDIDGPEVFVGTSKGLAHGIGEGYYPGLKPSEAQETQATSQPAPETTGGVAGRE